MTLPKGLEKLPKGVERHGKQLRISFMFAGIRCREPLKGIAKIDKRTIAYADNKLKVIRTEIKEGRFDYATHFPDSKRAALFSGWGGPDMGKLVTDGVKEWLAVQEKKKAASTFRGYKSKAQHVLTKWPHRRIADVPKSEIELFQAELLNQGLSPKTVNDTFTVVRGVWCSAFEDGIIRTNPLDRIPNVERDETNDYADPFTLQELERIQSVKTMRQQDINMIMFASWCGLSVSELIALSWDDVDTVDWVIHVRRARVDGEFKVPKERARIRRVELIEPAKYWLKRQQASSFMLPPVIIQVKQRDNVTVKDDTLRLVFRNGLSNLAWNDGSLRRWFKGHLARAKVRHRGPNQCRHTFASQMLSNFVSLEWVARQLGHTDTTMVKKHYGRWIHTDTPNMADQVSKMLGYDTDKGGQKTPSSAPFLPQK
ncbi:site-specific integrase [Marinobacter daepoensis]|uniref:Arm DNA-binding domain-containing protein n=1 Tax=Marinobacter daepoensis TaxID=262077 RepID=UPI001C93C1A3|nr:site-specific integrase [Marinobacter daepoensis]